MEIHRADNAQHSEQWKKATFQIPTTIDFEEGICGAKLFMFMLILIPIVLSWKTTTMSPDLKYTCV